MTIYNCFCLIDEFHLINTVAFKAGPKAPAEGLTLISIEEETLPAVIREENEHWSYRVNQGEIESFGKAYIQIYECDECDFERLLLRLVKQASRNGAAQIHVRDNTGHLTLGYKAEYFTFRQEYTQWDEMENAESHWYVTSDEKKNQKTVLEEKKEV